ncbi:nuclear factor 7, ovary-like [Nelusetta ayraudi]|uniref:nuclear factor 7, ovary-like n=1 Tax=Nelusetta ayraudi TaxID=303726 RepID=UPI003F6FA063
MADTLAAVQSYLDCPVCLETFKDPVSLSCTHSVCSNCLQKFWKDNTSKNCPVCKRKSSKDMPIVNFALKQLADTFASRSKSVSTGTAQVNVELVCSKHKEVKKMYCEDEQKPLCAVCDFSFHHGHKVVTVEEAVRGLKEGLKSDLTALKDKREKCRDVEDKYKRVIQHANEQVLSTEKQIRAEFDKLRLFLREEEESSVAALREEEGQKRMTLIREVEKVQAQVSSLSTSITAVEEELQRHNVAFLNSYKDSQSRARVQCSMSDPQLAPGALIDVAKHLGNLSFTVWQKMKDKVHFSPVILDPNTAYHSLHLSDDLTSMRRGEPSQQIPDNPERYAKFHDVLGSEGFSSGQHSWELEVRDLPSWIVGVAKESVDRKGMAYASPNYGNWCLLHKNGKYTNGSGGTVTVKKRLERISVQLDFDKGTVSFYDAVDMTHIYTHVDTFTEKLFPYFNIGKTTNLKTADLRICERSFSVTLGKDGGLMH